VHSWVPSLLYATQVMRSCCSTYQSSLQVALLIGKGWRDLTNGSLDVAGMQGKSMLTQEEGGKFHDASNVLTPKGI
jgi:hypothetical protein